MGVSNKNYKGFSGSADAASSCKMIHLFYKVWEVAALPGSVILG